MFTTKHFIWIGICILFILIMNHMRKKKISRYKMLVTSLCLYVYLAKLQKDVRYDP